MTMQALNIELRNRPPYFPDLGPYNFFLFPHIRNACEHNDFRYSEEAVIIICTHFLIMTFLLVSV